MLATYKISSALKYYLSSLLTLIQGIENWYLIPLVIFKKPLLIKLRNGLKYQTRSLMEIWTIKEVCLDKQYEMFVKLKKDWIVIDVGASIGDFAIQAAQKAKQVFAYEPDHVAVQLLKHNLKLNQVNNVEIFLFPATSLNQIINTNKLNRCDFLKIDCEGCEYRLLNNSNSQSFKKIKRIMLEYHLFSSKYQRQFKELKQLLIRHQFEIIEKENSVHNNIGFLYAEKKK